MDRERESEENERIIPSEIIREDELLQEALALSISPEFKVGLKVMIFNAEMRRRRKELGLTQQQLNQRLQEKGVNIGSQAVGQIERFYRFPNEELAGAIAEELETTPEVLFPSWLKFCVLEKGRGTVVLERPVDFREIQLLRRRASGLALPSPRETDPEVLAFEESLKNKIQEVLASLDERDRKMVELKYLEGYTYKEIGRIFGMTEQGARYRTEKALSKLRHPKHSRKLRDFL